MNTNTATKSHKYLLLEQINYAESVINRNLDAPEVTRLVEGMGSYTGGSDESEYTETCKLRIIATAAYLAGKQQADKDTTAILEAAKELGRVDALQELAKFGTDQISVYEEGEGFRWHHAHYMRTISEGNTVDSLLAYLDAHREVV